MKNWQVILLVATSMTVGAIAANLGAKAAERSYAKPEWSYAPDGSTSSEFSPSTELLLSVLDEDQPRTPSECGLLALGVAQAAFPCTIDRVIDGDTVQATISLGYHVDVHARCRLLNYDAPEMTGAERPDGIRARDMLADLLDDGLVSIVGGNKQDGFGRWLVSLRLADGSDPVDRLLEAGYGHR